MHILINSHRDSHAARTMLLESLRRNQEFDDTSIIVVVGGCEREDRYTKDGLEWRHVRHNSIDFTALIEAMHMSNNADETYMYIHDTCIVEPTFISKVNAIDMTGCQTRRLHHTTSMNMGVYRQGYLNQYRDSIPMFMGTGDTMKDKQRCIDMEDWFFRHDPTCRVIGRGLSRVLPQRDVYNTGTMRISEVYDDIGLTKFKANWNVNPSGQYQLRN